MTGMIHNETFATYGEAVLQVEAWAEEARRDGCALGGLLAVIDATSEPRSVAMLASRTHWLTAARRFGRSAQQLKTAVKKAPATALYVWTCSPTKVQTAPLTELADAIREIRASKGDA